MGQDPARLEIFSGWKEIAAYLRKGVRTVQRYDRELRLPVHRPSGASRSGVIATKVELDAWIAASPVREALRFVKRDPDHTALFKQFSLNLERMNQLGSDFKDLRAEFSRSLALLHQSLDAGLRAQFPSNHPAADVLIFDPKRKAS